MEALKQILQAVNLDRTDIPSQVTIPERKVLKYIGAYKLPNPRMIVDLGSGAGSATLAIAEGLALRGEAFPPIHAYDWFSLGPGHYATEEFKAISAYDSASFLEDFKYFLRPYIDNITIHSGDILRERWKYGDIDLLFVDLCKDIRIFNHVAIEFFAHLKPGSFLVHQDFSRPRLPWLHYSAGIMESNLQPLIRTGGSVFYKVIDRPSTDLISEMTDPNMPIEKRKAMARRGIENAIRIQSYNSEHFSCLAEFTDIYIDYWFNDRAVAKQRYLGSANLAALNKFYPELRAEIAR